MTFVPCSVCGARPKGKLVWCAWVWWTMANERVAYKTTVCADCFRDQVTPLVRKSEESEVLTCPGCGGSSEHDLDGVYLTVAIPEYGKRQFELAYDGPCAAKLRIWVQQHGVRLEDKVGGQGPSPQPSYSSRDVFSALGIEPRG